MCPRTGRPVSENPKSARIEIRVTPEEKKEIMDYAKSHKISLLNLLKLGMEAEKNK